MKCPVCDGELKVEIVAGVQIEYCTSCDFSEET